MLKQIGRYNGRVELIFTDAKSTGHCYAEIWQDVIPTPDHDNPYDELRGPQELRGIVRLTSGTFRPLAGTIGELHLDEGRKFKVRIKSVDGPEAYSYPPGLIQPDFCTKSVLDPCETCSFMRKLRLILKGKPLFATRATLRIELTEEASLAAMRARSRFGMAIAAMIRIIATTISNSINEKPFCLRIISVS